MAGTAQDIAEIHCSRMTFPIDIDGQGRSSTPPGPSVVTALESPGSPNSSAGLVFDESVFAGLSEAQIQETRARAAERKRIQTQEDAEQRRRIVEALEPEPGAKNDDTRIYTGNRTLGYKYWGVKPDDVFIDDYWVIRDPRNTRYREATYQKLHDEAPVLDPPPRHDSPLHARRKRGRPKKSATCNVDHGDHGDNANLDSLINGNGIAHPDQVLTSEIGSSRSTKRRRGRPAGTSILLEGESTARTKAPTGVKPKPSAKRAKVTTEKMDTAGLGLARASSDVNNTADSVVLTPAATSKRSLSAKTRSTKRGVEPQTRPFIGSNGDVRKWKAREERPSTHTMRTRAQGAA